LHNMFLNKSILHKSQT